MGRQKDALQKLDRTFRTPHRILRLGLAECLGTLILVTFSCAGVAQWMLSGGTHGTFLSVNLAVGGGVTLGVLLSGPISGESFHFSRDSSRKGLMAANEVTWPVTVVTHGAAAVEAVGNQETRQTLASPSRGRHQSFCRCFFFPVVAASRYHRQLDGAQISAKGGHLNPAVTFALCLLGRESWKKFPSFFFFQTLGAFLAAAVVYCLYFDAIREFGHGEFLVVGKNATAGIFATYPSQHLSVVNGFLDQIIGTAALITCILAIIDPHNNSIPRGQEAFPVGLVVLVIGLTMGFNAGYAINPARDLGPRLFTAVAGWGSEVFTVNTYWSVVPVTAPFVGALVAVAVYQLMIGCQYNQNEPESNTNPEVRKEEMLKLSNVSTNEEEI
ncbi:aquaporin-3-like [Corythoichthys intestinalis]|uniref:aquaporin-3-like n=1 Tax=Corythoichthys intestinalis TaxID=161448 RepID=UPI0025A67F20|nr:aquaporin-3-like [Corythoichthys intestinalis]